MTATDTKDAKGTKTEAVATTSHGRKIMLTGKDGKEVARVDVIRGLWKDGKGLKRGDIRKHLEEEYNHKVAYQIVFAATKLPKAEAPADENANAKPALTPAAVK